MAKRSKKSAKKSKVKASKKRTARTRRSVRRDGKVTSAPPVHDVPPETAVETGEPVQAANV